MLARKEEPVNRTVVFSCGVVLALALVFSRCAPSSDQPVGQTDAAQLSAEEPEVKVLKVMGDAKIGDKVAKPGLKIKEGETVRTGKKWALILALGKEPLRA